MNYYHIELKDSFNLDYLDMIYYTLIGKNYLVDLMKDDAIKSRITLCCGAFKEQFQKNYGLVFEEYLSKLTEIENIDLIEEDLEKVEEKEKIFTFIFNDNNNSNYLKEMLRQFKSSLNFGRVFIYLWNLKYEIDKKMIPELPDFKELIKKSSLNKDENVIRISDWKNIGKTVFQLAQAASVKQKEYPVNYGDLVIESEVSNDDYWSVNFTEIDANRIRMIVYTKASLENRNIRLILEDDERTYILAELDDMEADSKEEFEVDTKRIPLKPWKINLPHENHKISLQEKNC